MKLLLHHLKYDFLRWRWLVAALWALVVLHAGVFTTAEMIERPEWADQYGRTMRVWGEIAPWLAHGALGWAVVLVVLTGAADSPVRGRTWLLTRAGDRRVRVAARMGFVLAGLVLPLALGYAVMYMAAGFDAGTVGHSLWLALRYAVPVALALWLWMRAWPHVPGLILGLLMTCSVSAAAYAMGMRLPAEWFALLPSWPVMVGCLSLPVLVCLRAAGKKGRRAAGHGMVAGLLLPVLWWAGGAVSHGLRRAFPGPLERALFAGSGEEWTLPPAPESVPGNEVFLEGGVPWLNWSREVEPHAPTVWNVQVLAASWQRAGESAWSQWRTAGGSVAQDKDGRLQCWVNFDREGLSGVENLRMRLRVLVVIRAQEALDLPQQPDIAARGHGWTYSRRTVPDAAAPRVRERGRVALGMGLSYMMAYRTPRSSTGWGPGTGAYDRGAGLYGFHFENRAWHHIWQGSNDEEARLFAAAPTRLVFSRGEECVRTLVIPSLRVVVRQAEPETAPVPRVPQVEPPPELEPFRGYTRSVVWPARADRPVPPLGGSAHEAAYYIHWLKQQRKLPAAEDIAPLVRAWWSPCVEIAVREELPPESALLRALVAGWPEEQRGEILQRLRAAPWLASVVEARGWLAEAKPIVLDMLRREKRPSGALLPLCRAFRDPVFHEWMRKDFQLDAPTVIYWESMPDLAPELPARLAQASPRAHMAIEQAEALLTAGDKRLLRELLKVLVDQTSSQKITAGYLERWVLDAEGNPPPATGLVRDENGRLSNHPQRRVPPEFLQWFAGLTADDFTFDRTKRRFVRIPSTPPPP